MITATPFRIFTLIVAALSAVRAFDDDLCCLCDGCEPAVSGREGAFQKNGKMCQEMILEMADPSNGSRKGTQQCIDMQNQFRRPCCDKGYTGQSYAPPNINVDESKNYPRGGAPWCDVCHDGKMPGKPNTVTATLGIPGTPTCKDLYYMGRNGLIPDQLCNPLQDAYDADCLCYHFSGGPRPGGGGGGGAAPTPSNGWSGGGGGSSPRTPPRRQKPRTKSKNLSLFQQSARGNINRGRDLSEGRLRGRSD